MADQDQQNRIDPITPIADTIHTIFLAGVGAVAATGEKGSELFQQLVAKGEETVQQGKDVNNELLKQAKGKVSDTAESALRSYLKTLSPEERAKFVASVQKAAADAESDTADAAQEVAAEAATVDVEDKGDEDPADQVADDVLGDKS